MAWPEGQFYHRHEPFSGFGFETRQRQPFSGRWGGALGFLRHNFHPSHIIMGDAEPLFGYVLAATSI